MAKWLNIANKIISTISGWIVLLTLIFFFVFSLTILPDQAKKAEVYSAESGSPDLSLFYTSDDLYRMADQFGPEGRMAYVRARFSFDLAWPAVYGAFLLASAAWALGVLTDQNNSWRLLVFIPLLAVIFDLLENTTAAIVIGRFPSPSFFAALIAPYFTLLKWIFVVASFALSVLLSVVALIKVLKK
jgi:hypothetical protein